MTTKELSYLNDTLNGEQVIIKKYQDYCNSIQDQQLQSVCQDALQTHQKHYNQLCQQLNC